MKIQSFSELVKMASSPKDFPDPPDLPEGTDTLLMTQVKKQLHIGVIK
jgi:hypothetical protein